MKARLILPITSASEVMYYGLTVTLPFIPFIGLSLEIEGYAYTVEGVSYCLDDDSVEVMLEQRDVWSAGGNWDKWKLISRQPYSRP